MTDQQRRLARAADELARAEDAPTGREQRCRVLVAIRHLIAWLGVGNETGTEADCEFDADMEASRNG